MNILVINGPNLNLLGEREREIYGNETLEELMMWLENSPECVKHNFKFYQSNHEGEIIDFLHDERHWAQGIVINPGALSHYSYAIMDAIKAVKITAVEVHITDIKKRESFRKISVINQACIKQISGLGKYSYLEAVKTLIEK
mgnify:FL=1|tara:strand:+ start:1138 stop:1563 length:426 start_codon:yes stop_codon:yes gene_type:complete